MTLQQAIDVRRSRRKYLKSPIDWDSARALQIKADQFNRLSGLHIQLVLDGQKAFAGFRHTYGLLTGVQSYFAMVGPEDDADLGEKVGYYGELLVLEATALGLGTCWVAGSYDRENAMAQAVQGERLVCVIAVGNVEEKRSLKERSLYKVIHRYSKPLDEFYRAEGEIPDWFLPGMEAVQKAPSAANRQPVLFLCRDGVVCARVPGEEQLVDLGIAKAHFEIGSGAGKFRLGNGGVLVTE